MNGNRYEVISFDLFSTLVHVKRQPGYNWKKEIEKIWLLAENHPVEISLDDFFLKYRKKMKAKITRLDSPELGEDFKEQLLSDFICEILNDGATKRSDYSKLASDMANSYFDNSLNDIFIYPAVPKLLSRLKKKGYHIVLTSDHSWPPNGHDILEKFDLKDYFNNIIFSGEAGYRKPSPVIFDKAIEGFELSSRENMLHIGDNYPSDIKGILDYGGKAIWIDHKNERETKTPSELTGVIQVISGIEHFPVDI